MGAPVGTGELLGRLRRGWSRRALLKYGLMSLALYFIPAIKWGRGATPTRFLRPPGAIPESDFLRKCIRCGLCADTCPNQCIKYFDLGSGRKSGTPYIVPREQACILCMKCNNVCPSGALRPVERELDDIRTNVRMGVAVLDTNLCYSYNNRSCGVCYRACPLQDLALKVGFLERPILIQENCVGCGNCERICYHYPQAIRVMPVEERDA